MKSRQRNPKEEMKIFKKVLLEAADMYQKPAHTIVIQEFNSVNNNRISVPGLRRYGTYGLLREYVAPSPTKSTVLKDQMAMFRRILEKSTQKSA